MRDATVIGTLGNLVRDRKCQWSGEAVLASDSHWQEQHAADLAVGLSEAVVFVEVVCIERKSPAAKSSNALQRIDEDCRLALEFRAVLDGGTWRNLLREESRTG